MERTPRYLLNLDLLNPLLKQRVLDASKKIREGDREAFIKLSICVNPLLSDTQNPEDYLDANISFESKLASVIAECKIKGMPIPRIYRIFTLAIKTCDQFRKEQNMTLSSPDQRIKE